jgi:hypothetical protein
VWLCYVAEKTGAYGEKVSYKLLNKKSEAPGMYRGLHFFYFYFLSFYCASEIRICTPPRVVVMGGEVEIFGSTRRCSKYNFKLTRLLIT